MGTGGSGGSDRDRGFGHHGGLSRRLLHSLLGVWLLQNS
jgi:hypothetical protein